MWREREDAVATLDAPAADTLSSEPMAETPVDEPMRLVPDHPCLPAPAEPLPILALLCHEAPGSVVGQFVANLARTLAGRELSVHVFAPLDFELEAFGVASHALGLSDADDLRTRVQEFADRAAAAFVKVFDGVTAPITLLAHEWSTLAAVTRLRELKPMQFLLSLHSLERQRADMTSEISQWIEAIELAALRDAKNVLVHDPATTEVLRSMAPECEERILPIAPVFPAQEFATPLDPGSVKARFDIAPLDPMILFVGDLDDRYGPDLLIKALPAVRKNHPGAKLVIVGAGHLYWPLRVYQRYLLLEPAVRLLGHMEGEGLRELIQAADVVAVPSRGETPWWPIQAAWAAGRPVVATHDAAPGMIEHEKDGVLVYPSENSIVWGIERVWYDPALRETLAEAGRAKLAARFGWGSIADLVAERLAAAR